MTTYTFYLLCSKSKDIKDFYIGSTKDLKYRKYQHKHHSNNPNSLKRHQKKYQCIINNGGINEWQYIELCTLEGSKQDCFHKEKAFIELLQPTLNQRNPIK